MVREFQDETKIYDSRFLTYFTMGLLGDLISVLALGRFELAMGVFGAAGNFERIFWIHGTY